MFRRIAKKFGRKSKVQEITVEARKISSEELFPLIEKKAYEFYVKRGCIHGNDMDDWLEAEKAIMGDLNQ